MQREGFFPGGKLTSEEPRDATTTKPLNANTKVVDAQKREKKKERPTFGICIRWGVNGREISR